MFSMDVLPKRVPLLVGTCGPSTTWKTAVHREARVVLVHSHDVPREILSITGFIAAKITVGAAIVCMCHS